MLPPEVEAAIAAIARDHTSGASTLAHRALEAMTLLIDGAKGHPSPSDLEEIARRLSDAQPAMAIVHNVAYLFAQLASEGVDPAAVVDQIGSDLDSAKDRIARTFLKVAPEGAEVVTTSFSENVLAVLETAYTNGKITRVTALESRPLLEGRDLATALRKRGIPVSLAPDALGPTLVARADGVLIGADSVLRDGGIVNKIGSYGLALAAKEHAKPVYVACESLKFDARYDAKSWPGLPARNPRELWDEAPDHIAILNHYFEVVPAKLVTLLITERGSYAPDIVRTMLAQARNR